MKKRHKILSLLGLLLLVLVLGGYLFRNQFAGFMIRRVVYNESKGKISLDFDQLNLQVFQKKLVLYSPYLDYNDIYINLKDSVLLGRSSFGKVIITNVSLWDLLKNHQLICDNLTIEKPDFILKNTDSLKHSEPSSVDPASIISIFRSRKISTIDFQFLIKHTQINFGHIQLVPKPKVGEFGSTDYSITIQDLGTSLSKTTDKQHTLSYKRMEIKIRNLKRHSEEKQLDMSIDSAQYSSKENRFIIHGFWFKTLKDTLGSVKQLNLHLNWISLSGLRLNEENTPSKDISFDALKMIGGTITIGKNKAPINISKRVKSNELANYLKNYGSIFFDSLIGQHIHVYQLSSPQDTILNLRRLNFRLTKARVSSKAIEEPLKYIGFDSLDASIEQLKSYDPKSGILLKSALLKYNNTKKILSLEQITASQLCLKQQVDLPIFSGQKILIRNLSARKFQNASKQLLSIEFLSPNFQIDLDSACRRMGKFHVSPLLLPLKVTGLRFNNGNIKLSKGNEQLNINKINLFINGLITDQLLEKKPQINFDTLEFDAQHALYSSKSPDQHIKCQQIKWKGNKFSIRQLNFSQDSGKRIQQFRIPAMTFTNFRINDLIFHKKLIASGAYFYKPSVSLNLRSTQKQSDTSYHHWNRFEKFPIKVYWANVYVNHGQISIKSNQQRDSLQLSTQVDMQLRDFKIGYEKQQFIATPSKWQVQLSNILFRRDQYVGRISKVLTSSETNNFSMLGLSVQREGIPNSQFYIKVPNFRFRQLNLHRLMSSDSVIFNSLTLSQPEIHLDISRLPTTSSLSSFSPLQFEYDSIKMIRANFRFVEHSDSSAQNIIGRSLNLSYHPLFRHPDTKETFNGNLLSRWDLSLNKLIINDSLKKTQIIAYRIALQSLSNKLKIHLVVSTNFSDKMLAPGSEKTFVHLQLENTVFTKLWLPAEGSHNLHIGHFEVPRSWINILNEKNQTFSATKLFEESRIVDDIPFLKSIHVDSTNLKDVFISYHYQNRKKLLSVNHIGISINNIQLGDNGIKTSQHYFFKSMLVDLKGKSIISGDSLYTFRTKDIRINLPNKSIYLDSIALSPRFKRKQFFEKSVYQTDRITLYGKNIELNNFDLNSMLSNKHVHFGSIQFNHFNILFERDKRFPMGNKIKPLPIDMLKQVPITFFVDSIQLLNNQISYYEYNAKASQPGIFFVDNFNLHVLNVTNDLNHIDSSLVLKFHGTGRLMKQSDFSFALVMPYFAPNNQFWFSGQTGLVDLSQFNSLTQNTMGIGVASGKGSVEIPYVTGDNSFVKGNMFFLYRNLKLRLYNRKKAQMHKGIGSPFINFMLNDLMIRSDNPKFLKNPRKGIIYYVRNPHKSFINYLWKSSLSGMLSTLGFNNKQQRIGKREDKKAVKQQKK